MTTLDVAPGLSLPVELVTQKNAILAMSGAGKSNTAVVLAEEMHAAEIPFVAVDPKGDWWGIRSNAAGDGPGLPIPVFGGLHGDIPLEHTAGKVIGNLIAESRLTCVLDVSEFDSKAQQMRFLTDLAETLLRRNRDPLHLFLEEADDYLPQRVFKDQAACVGAWQRVVKRGRFRGLGCTLITQRSAALNKDALNQVDNLIPMRVTAPRDRKAIEEWVEAKALGKELVDSLPELENGEAWIWSPQALKLMERVHFRRRRTFDSGETPVLGRKARPPATLADVDLDALKDEMAETIERAEADDPRKLRNEIARLTAQVRDLEQRPAEAEVRVEYVEVPIVGVEAIAALRESSGLFRQLVDVFAETMEPATAKLDTALDAILEAKGAVAPPPPPTRPGPTAPPRPPRPRPVTAGSGPGERLPRAERLVLTALAQYPQGRTETQVAILAGYKAGTGGFNNAVSALRSKGYLSGGKAHLVITDAGHTALGEYDPVPTGRALADYWLNHVSKKLMGKAERAHLQVLVDVAPDELPVADVATRAGYTPGTGGSNNALSRLRTLELITRGDPVRLSDELTA